LKEKLIIKNFGPIKSVDLDLGKITVLIGEQATGKSTVAKVLAVCRYFSYIVNFSDKQNELDKFTNNLQFSNGLKDWGINDYLKKDSEIIYENHLYTFEFKTDHVIEHETLATPNDLKKEFFETHTRIKANSKSFEDLLNQLFSLRKDEIENDFFELLSWTPNENFFRLNVKKVMDNPLFVPAERGFQSLSVGKDSLLPDAILDELAKINKIVRGYNTDIDITPLNIIFRNENGLSKIKKSSNSDFHFLHLGASGYQSTIPVYLAVKFNNDLKINKGRTIIIEEPELNLFPLTQKKLVEFFIGSINQYDNQFLLPTHSPYVLTTLSNLIYAHKIGSMGNGKFEKEVDSIISKQAWINVNDIAVYYLNDGHPINMVNAEECIINLDNLDNVSEIINEEFDELLNIELMDNSNG
tara:strand:+ start:7711 stop:8946 length:1236 start_codon:yes stop_codon:yes gene_type:complete